MTQPQDARPEDDEEDDAPEPEDEDFEAQDTWQPRRGRLYKAVAWFIILMTLACVGVMIAAIITRGVHALH